MKTPKERISNYSKNRGVIRAPYEADLPHSNQPISPDQPDEHCKPDYEQNSTTTKSKLQRNGWEQFIVNSGPYAYMWTESFVRPYSDAVLLDALWQCTRHVNRELWGPRWQKKGLGLCGTVIAEAHELSLDVRNRLHFHVLLHPQQGNEDLKRLNDVIATSSGRLKDGYGRNMSAEDRVDVREVYALDALAGYVTKSLWTQHWTSGDNIFFIRPGGIEGVVLKARSSSALKKLH